MTRRIGVFLLDSIDEPHRSIAGDYDVLFSGLLEPKLPAGAELVMVDARTADELPDHADCDGWVIPGSRQSVYDDDPWIDRLRTWTAEALDRRTPLAGICFGHQLVAQAMGAPVAKFDGGWNIGAIDYEVEGESAHVDAPERFRLIASHQDQVLQLPAGAELFATAPRCAVAGFTVDDHVLTVQGHPEFEAPLAASLYRSRVERIGQAPVDEALATLDRTLDRHDVASWLVATIHAAAGNEVSGS
ncbi:MAG: type 1 glutamine amidotransferase [Actinomycetota bacterium]